MVFWHRRPRYHPRNPDRLDHRLVDHLQWLEGMLLGQRASSGTVSSTLCSAAALAAAPVSSRSAAVPAAAPVSSRSAPGEPAARLPPVGAPGEPTAATGSCVLSEDVWRRQGAVSRLWLLRERRHPRTRAHGGGFLRRNPTHPPFAPPPLLPLPPSSFFLTRGRQTDEKKQPSVCGGGRGNKEMAAC